MPNRDEQIWSMNQGSKASICNPELCQTKEMFQVSNYIFAVTSMCISRERRFFDRTNVYLNQEAFVWQPTKAKVRGNAKLYQEACDDHDSRRHRKNEKRARSSRRCGVELGDKPRDPETWPRTSEKGGQSLLKMFKLYQKRKPAIA